MNTRISAALAACALASGLAGCVAPSVKYNLIPLDHPRPLTDKEFESYYLQGSVVTIASKTNAGGGPAATPDAETPDANAAPADNGSGAPNHSSKGSKPGKGKPRPSDPNPSSIDDVTVKSTPVEYTAYKLTLEHNDPFWSFTSVSLKKVDNRELVSEVGVDVTDYRVEYIKAIGAVVATAAKYVTASPRAELKPLDTSRLPLQIDFTGILKNEAPDDRDARHIDIGNEGLDLELGPLPQDAYPLSPNDFPLSTDDYLYAACRTLTVYYRISSAGAVVSQSVKIADPNFLERVKMPSSGKVTMGSECGESLAPEKSSVQTGPDLINALQVEGQAMVDVVKAAKPGGSGSGGGGGGGGKKTPKSK